jgi:hypothetical protein
MRTKLVEGQRLTMRAELVEAQPSAANLAASVSIHSENRMLTRLRTYCGAGFHFQERA